MIAEDQTRRRGGPLLMLGLLVTVWIGGRAVTWDNPFQMPPLSMRGVEPLIADRSEAQATPVDATLAQAAAPSASIEWRGGAVFARASTAVLSRKGRTGASFLDIGEFAGSAGGVFSENPRIAAGHSILWAGALAHSPMPRAVEPEPLAAQSTAQSPFAASPLAPTTKAPQLDRWTLDAWAFGRQGSNAAAIAQGRAPIYGASQIGAVLRYRLAPSSRRSPEAYARVYRALVTQGESEAAFGISARPIGSIPLRAQAELRVTDNQFGTRARPAAFVVTELPPRRLPAGITAEAYGQAGYVGGTFATAFADGQITMTREVAQFDLASNKSARFSIGAGAWGGAQRDTARADLGPTMRLDLTIGSVPARISVDWREQVAGDAAPGSGVAATLSTRF